MNEVRTCMVDALKDLSKKELKMSGSKDELMAWIIVCTPKASEIPSAFEELLVDKRDYQDIYKEGPGTSVDPARLKTGYEKSMQCPMARNKFCWISFIS